jgi:hypothetical protein
MRDIQDVLKQKELELEHIKMEMEALRIVAPLLEEESDNAEVDEIVRKDGTTGLPVKSWP